MQVVIFLGEIPRRVCQYPVLPILPVRLFAGLGPQLVHPLDCGVVFLAGLFLFVLRHGQPDFILRRFFQDLPVLVIHGVKIVLIGFRLGVFLPFLRVGTERCRVSLQCVGRPPVLVRGGADAVGQLRHCPQKQRQRVLILLALFRVLSLCGLHFLQLPNQKVSRVCRRQDFSRRVLMGFSRFLHFRVQFPCRLGQLPHRRSAVPRGVHKSYYRRSRSGGSAYNCQERSRRCCEQ